MRSDNIRETTGSRVDVLGFTHGLGQTFLAVALVLADTLDGHLKRSEVVLELEVDGALGGGELDLDVVLLPLDLVDLRDVLHGDSQNTKQRQV